jgi:hypothetical protein
MNRIESKCQVINWNAEGIAEYQRGGLWGLQGRTYGDQSPDGKRLHIVLETRDKPAWLTAALETSKSLHVTLSPIDDRDLLKRYIAHVGARGKDELFSTRPYSSFAGTPFTEEELTELRILNAESKL